MQGAQRPGPVSPAGAFLGYGRRWAPHSVGYFSVLQASIPALWFLNELKSFFLCFGPGTAEDSLADPSEHKTETSSGGHSCVPSSLGKSPAWRLGPTSVLPEPCDAILKCVLLLAAVSRRRQRETHWASIHLLARSPHLRSPFRRCEPSKALEHLNFKEQPPPLSAGAKPCAENKAFHSTLR